MNLLKKSIIALFKKGRKGQPELIGSGVFLKNKDNYYIVTTAHVIKHFEESKVIYLYLDNDYYSIGCDVFKSDYNLNNYDVAILKIDNFFIQRILNFNYSPLYNVNDNNYDSKYKINVLIAGFPCSKAKVNVGEKTSKLTLLQLYTKLIEPDKYKTLGYSPNDFILYIYPKLKEDGNKMIEPHGMSGGGIFLEFRDEKCIEYILIGILIEYNDIKSDITINVALSYKIICKIINTIDKNMNYNEHFSTGKCVYDT